MLNCIRVILVSLSVFILVAPNFADARAGGGRSSMGSRGIKTYSPSKSNAAPIQRSMTNQPNQALKPGFNPTQQPGIMPTGGNSFWRGMAGGFLGAGIASMLFGHGASAMGSAGGGSGSAFGGLLQILLIGGLGYFAYRMFRGSSSVRIPPLASNFSGNFSLINNAYTQQQEDSSRPLEITDNDKSNFEQLLKKIQHSWSEGEINKLRQFVTPEMLQYFSEEMSANSSRGIANKVENVALESAEVIESWQEFELEYATVRLQWSAFDYMVSLNKNQGEDGYIISGSSSQTEFAEEIWTFARASGGNWLLSAIQQLN